MDSHVVHENDIGMASSHPFVVHAVETAGENEASNKHAYVRGNLYTSETGVVLELRKVPRMVVVEAGMKLSLPKPPQVYVPDQDRYEENPLDPDYEDELQKAKFYKGIASTNVYLSLGTSIKSLPEGMDRPENDEWAQALEELGLDIPSKETRRSRYVAWLRYYALNDKDFTELTKASALFSGHITEEQVKQAEDSFRSEGTGDTDTGTAPTSEN